MELPVLVAEWEEDVDLPVFVAESEQEEVDLPVAESEEKVELAMAVLAKSSFDGVVLESEMIWANRCCPERMAGWSGYR